MEDEIDKLNHSKFTGPTRLILYIYRSISPLSLFNKFLEKLVFKRLSSFIEKYNILYHKHFRFRSNHSTVHSIFSIIDKIQTAIEGGKYSCGIFLDLSKPFDTVNHIILLQKLECSVIRGVATRQCQLGHATIIFKSVGTRYKITDI